MWRARERVSTGLLTWGLSHPPCRRYAANKARQTKESGGAMSHWDETTGRRIPDDHLLTDEEEAHLARADLATQLVSNGEYAPLPQSAPQKQVEARINQMAEEAARKLGVSRRRFLMGSGGMAASFLAMNEIYGPFFDIDPL